MTKMAAMPILVKPLQKSSPEPVDRFQRNDMKHRWLKHYNVYINHQPVMTLTYAFEWGKLLKII